MFIVKRTSQSPRQLCQSVYSSGLAVDVAIYLCWRTVVGSSTKESEPERSDEIKVSSLVAVFYTAFLNPSVPIMLDRLLGDCS